MDIAQHGSNWKLLQKRVAEKADNILYALQKYKIKEKTSN